MSPCDLRRVLRTTKLSALPSSCNVWIKWATQDLDSTNLGDVAHMIGLPIEVVSSHSSSKLIRIGTKKIKDRKQSRIFGGFYQGSKSTFFSEPIRNSTKSFRWTASPSKNSKTFTVHKEESNDHGWWLEAKRISEVDAFKKGVELDERESDNVIFHSTGSVKSIYIEIINASEKILVAPSTATLEICKKILPKEWFASRSCLKHLLPWCKCGDVLNVEKFYPTKFMDKIFPLAWKDKDFINLQFIVNTAKIQRNCEISLLFSKANIIHKVFSGRLIDFNVAFDSMHLF